LSISTGEEEEEEKQSIVEVPNVQKGTSISDKAASSKQFDMQSDNNSGMSGSGELDHLRTQASYIQTPSSKNSFKDFLS